MRQNASPIRLITFLVDLLLINLAFVFAHRVRYDLQFPQPILTYHSLSDYGLQQLLLNGLLLFTFWRQKVWRRRRGEFWIDEVGRVINATALGMALIIIYVFVVFPPAFSRFFWALVPLFIVFFLAVARLVRRWFLFYFYARGWWTDPVLIIGSGETGRSLIRTLLARPDLGFLPLGYMHNGGEEDLATISRRIPDLGHYANLAAVLEDHPELHTVFIALPADRHPEVMRLVTICRRYEIPVQVAPDMFQLSLNRVESTNMAGIPTLGIRDEGFSALDVFLKRILDLTLVVLLAVPALVIGAVIAAAIKLGGGGGPVFYVAERVGRDGKPFQMVKFRSMVVDAESQKSALAQLNEADGPIFKIKDDPRLTRVGRLIRRLSLDELPQLLNVVKGEMSLVGPRPPLKEEVERYQPWHRQRLSVLGGITGLWQVSGRSDLTFDEQCLLDIYYIENWSLALDLRIIFQTIPFALFGRGAY